MWAQFLKLYRLRHVFWEQIITVAFSNEINLHLVDVFASNYVVGAYLQTFDYHGANDLFFEFCLEAFPLFDSVT